MNFKVLTAPGPLKAPLFLKTLLRMKIAVALILVFTVQSYGKSVAQVVTISERNVPLRAVIKKIEEQTGYYFWYEKDLLKNARTVTVRFSNTPLKKALEDCLKDQPFGFEIISKTIWLRPLETAAVQQVQEITGTVKDSLGNPLTAATIEIRGKAVSTITDQNGQFKIHAEPGDVIIISYVGYERKQILVRKETFNLDVVLTEMPREIENIVVTALGIKRADKALSYNVQSVAGDELTRNKDANFVNSLAGKVAGISINAGSAGIGSAARVVMRGTKSISGNNNALYVIDGIPVLNSTNLSTNAPAGQVTDIFSANTGSDIMSSINPEDIESISTLTGAAAAALYGSQGQNGVILINTKSGNKDRKTNLGLVNNTMYFTPLVMPEFQHTYGQTEEGSYYSWGPKLSTPSSYRPRDFFQMGNNTTFGLNFSTGTDRNQTFVSGAMVRANGIIPNNTLSRYNLSARNTSKFLNDKLTLDLNTRYIGQTEKNMVAQGLYHNPLVPIYLFPPGGNIEAFKVYERYNPDRLFPTQYWPYIGDQFRTENPWWIINREPIENTSKRLLLGATLKYDLFDWLNITARGNMDRTEIVNSYKRYASTDELFAGYGGSFYVSNTTAQALYGDLMANINKKVGNFTITGNIGGQRTESSSRTLAAGGGIAKGSPPNIFTTDNVAGSTGAGAGSGTAGQPDRTSFQSVFGLGGVSYKNMLFLDGSYRIDWYSQLYFNDASKLYLTYPSVGAAAVLSDLFNIPSGVVSYAKIRANYAKVGNPPRIYNGGPQVFLIAAGNINQNSPLHYPLKPERTSSWEAGANLKFLDNKINLDVTLYKTETYDQIFEVTQSASSGGNSTFLINAGQVNNRGIEGALGYKGNIGPLKWSSNATFTLNQNKVQKLFNTTGVDGNVISVDTINVAGGGSYQQKAAIGGSLSAIYTTAQLKLDQNGYVMLPLSVDGSKYIHAGNADPKYTIGWNNGFNYKNLSLNFLVFARIGGVGVSATQAMMDAYGVSQTSAEARERGSVTINGYPYQDVQSYYTQMGSGLNGVLGYYVYSATNVRLKELSLGYTIPGKLLGNVVKNLKLAVTGNNLFMFYNKAPFDPESTASSGTYYQGFDYFRQPSLRGIGFSINAQF